MSVDEPTQLEVQYAPVSSLHPNPWNPNKMDARTYSAERESIRAYGFVDPITCRPHPENLGEYEILDGEHRYRAAIDEKLEVVPIVVLPLDDARAKRLTIILNETRGEADPIALAILLRELEEIDPEEFRVGLPYTSKEMEELLEIGRVNWDEYDEEHREQVANYLSHSTSRLLSFDRDEAQNFDTWVEMIMRERDLARREQAILLALRELASRL